MIHSDFITTPNREDIVDCEWNGQLREGVALTYQWAIQQLIRDVYWRSWLHWLPEDKLERFWEPLPKLIFELLQSTRVLRVFGESSYRCPNDLRILPDHFLHDEEPLYPDTAGPTLYLSTSYSEAGMNSALSRLGTRILSDQEILDRVQADSGRLLGRYPLDGAWHVAFCEMMEKIWSHASSSRSMQNMKQRIKEMQIIPLVDLSWANSLSTTYFPTVEGQKIPVNIGVQLVSELALKTGTQGEMYRLLGVSECSPDIVKEKILYYQLEGSRYIDSFDCSDLLDQLRFLHYAGGDIQSNYKQSLLIPSRSKIRRASTQNYFSSDDDFHTEQLIHALGRVDSGLDNLYTDFFLDDSFSPSRHVDVYHHGLTWEQWLIQNAFIRYYPPLYIGTVEQERSKKLSPVLQRLHEVHSALFFSTLRAHWENSYSEALAKNKPLKDHLKRQPVQCTNNQRLATDTTYFPTSSIQDVSRDLGTMEAMPLVKLLEEQPAEDDWKFLRSLGVRFTINIDFWIMSLRVVRDTMHVRSARLQESVRKIYEKIGGVANQDMLEKLQVSLESEKLQIIFLHEFKRVKHLLCVRSA